MRISAGKAWRDGSNVAPGSWDRYRKDFPIAWRNREARGCLLGLGTNLNWTRVETRRQQSSHLDGQKTRD